MKIRMVVFNPRGLFFFFLKKKKMRRRISDVRSKAGILLQLSIFITVKVDPLLSLGVVVKIYSPGVSSG